MPSDAALARAHEVLSTHPVVDGHNDLPYALRLLSRYDFDRTDPAGPLEGTMTDLPRLRAGRVGGQFWSVYVPTSFAGADAVTATLEQVDAVKRMVARSPGDLALCRTAAGAERAIADGRIASLLGMEGGHSIDGSLGVLRQLAELGVRYLTLTHNDNVPWADSATDEPAVGGLSDFGRGVVAELNRLGVLVDLSHVAPTTMHDALDATASPVVFSHSSCRALCDHPRNVPDDVLEKLRRQKDGLVMATFIPDFISEEVRLWMEPIRIALANDPVTNRMEAIAERERAHGPRPKATLSQLADHIEYIAGKVGPERVGIGSDFFGLPTTPVGLEDVSRFPHLLAELFRRGWSEKLVAGVAGRNFIRVFQAVEREGERLRGRAKPAVGRTTEIDVA